MRKILSLSFILLLYLGCKKEVPVINDLSTFDAVIASGGEFEPVVQSETVLDTSSSTKTEGGQRWRCTTKTVEAKSGSGGSGGFPMFNPNANVIYPGSLLQGKSLRKATPDVIAVERAGGNDLL